MKDKKKTEKKPDAAPEQTCPSCGGTGQLSSFMGVSRFLLTCEECPECAGLGFITPTENKKG